MLNKGHTMKKESKAFGVITRNLFDLEPYSTFLENARSHGHHIDHLIIAYEDKVDKQIVKQLQGKCKVTLIKRGDSPRLNEYLIELGLDQKHIDTILCTPYHKEFGKISYGTSRNYVLIAALMLSVDYLLFFDSDIYPKILKEYQNGKYKFFEIDFVGSHLKHLVQNDVIVTTSDYSGYYIIPKMNFPYLIELLTGVQKRDGYYYISNVESPVTRDTYLENVFDTQKVLGGNLAIDISKIGVLPPFFSTTLTMHDECFLGRGEDTLFGPEIHGLGRCVDIDLLVFHNCFGDFPKIPDILLQKNLDRFFYACMGWIIRNPFLNWLRKQYNIPFECGKREDLYRSLVIGSRSAAEYFEDNRFLMLPEAFDLSYEKLEDDIYEYKQLILAWQMLRKLL